MPVGRFSSHAYTPTDSIGRANWDQRGMTPAREQDAAGEHESPRLPAAKPDVSYRSSGQSCLVLVLLAAAMAFAGARAGLWGESIGVVPHAISTIDPNRAPWWELAVLPGIGENTARAIVRERESAGRFSKGRPSAPVFAYPSDLLSVRGIGPKTVQRIAPYLRTTISD